MYGEANQTVIIKGHVLYHDAAPNTDAFSGLFDILNYDMETCFGRYELSQLYSQMEITPVLLRQVGDSVNLLPNGPQQLTNNEVYDVLTQRM